MHSEHEILQTCPPLVVSPEQVLQFVNFPSHEETKMISIPYFVIRHEVQTRQTVASSASGFSAATSASATGTSAGEMTFEK
jgi:hypothetical protein